MGTYHLMPRGRTGAATAARSRRGPVGSRAAGRGRAARGLALLAALALFALPNLRSNVAPLVGGDVVTLVHDCDGQGCIAPGGWGPASLYQDQLMWAAN
jgi:hypothetical protein